MTCGIYVIEHIDSGKKYVGSSVDIDRRFAEHRNSLRRGEHHSQTLQRAWDKYSEQAFRHYVLEECAEDMLLSREQWHFDAMQPFASEHQGFNENRVAGKPPASDTHSSESNIAKGKGWRGKSRGPMSPEQRAKVSAAKKGKKFNMTPEQIAARNAKAWAARRANGNASTNGWTGNPGTKDRTDKIWAARRANGTDKRVSSNVTHTPTGCVGGFSRWTP